MEDLDAVEYEGCTPPDVAETAKKVTLELLPSKSRKIYEKRYDEFIKWCNSNRINKYSENVLLTYFSKQAETYKAPSLWSLFSIFNLHEHASAQVLLALFVFEIQGAPTNVNVNQKERM
ncbi:hypothetical protein PPYR_02150 [Photinus pyralis]|uniref:Uncharacterized protein n=1 Tax=Photinus pyralis TaxID=7054 RepID=A0A5N4B749_PHOPY|nr:hypothetical protein PPYR_02150 [Photinus pyralis]